MPEVALAVAEALADEVRSLGTVPVDPFAIASALGVTVELRAMPPSVLGAAPSAVRVVVNDSLEGPLQRFVVAHELAHVLVKRGHARFADPRCEERFADAFAEALLVPKAAVVDASGLKQQGSRFGVEPPMIQAGLEDRASDLKPRAA